MQEPTPIQEYKRRRRDMLDNVVDHGELLIEIAQRYSRRRERWRGFWRAIPKALTIFGSIATPMAIFYDKVLAVWHWFWSAHGGH